MMTLSSPPSIQRPEAAPPAQQDLDALCVQALAAADQLIAAGCVTAEVVDGMRREMRDVQNDPDAVFFYSFVQARAVVY